MAAMGLLTDQIISAHLALDFRDSFETISAFALGYPVKSIDRYNGRLTLNIVYWKRMLLYREVRIRIFMQDESTSRIRVFGKIGVSPIHFLRCSGVSVCCIRREWFLQELGGFLAPYILADDTVDNVMHIESDAYETLR